MANTVKSTLLLGLLTGLLTMLVAITLLLDGERLLKGLHRLIPSGRREQAVGSTRR